MESLPITLTPKAIQMAKQKLAEEAEPVLGIRLGVKGGGCSGFSYVFDLARKVRARDTSYDFDGLTVVIDNKSVEYLKGSELDWETKLLGYGFKWNNPRAESVCGCGESFTLKD